MGAGEYVVAEETPCSAGGCCVGGCGRVGGFGFDMSKASLKKGTKCQTVLESCCVIAPILTHLELNEEAHFR